MFPAGISTGSDLMLLYVKSLAGPTSLSNPIITQWTCAIPTDSLLQAKVLCAKRILQPAAKSGPNSAGTGSP